MYEIATLPSLGCETCSGGWLLLEAPLLEGLYFSTKQRCLLNPISKKIIHLPTVENEDACDQFLISSSSSSSKAANSIYVVMLRRFFSLWVFRPGRDCKWRKEIRLNNFIFYATISHEEGKLYGLNHRNWLLVIELDTGNEEVLKLHNSQVPQSNYYGRNYGLVESCGEVFLVMVTTWEENCDEFNRRCLYWFDVFKADMEARAWVKVDSLGDRVLFVSHIGGSICVPTAETGGKANHIYYIPAESSSYWIEFDLGEGIAEAHSIPGFGNHVIESWIIPSLQ